MSFHCLCSNTKILNKSTLFELFEIRQNLNIQKSIFTKHLQVQYFQFERYYAFVNAIKMLLLDLFKGFVMHIV